MRSGFVIGVNAGVILALGLALLVPLVLSLLYRDGSWYSFLVPAAAMIPLGAAGLWASRLGSAGYVLERDVYLSVTLAWALAALLGGVPRLLGAEVSGLTRTRFTERIVDTAKVLVAVYLALSVATALALLVVGMGPYD